MSNVARLAKAVKGGVTVKSPTLERRQGVVQSVQSDGTATVTIGGDPNAVAGVKSNSNYVPQSGDTVALDVRDKDVTITDRTGFEGPSVFAGATQNFVVTNENRSASAYGDLTTVGPSVNVTISASGLCLVCVGATVTTLSASDGGFMSFAVTSGSSVVASDLNAYGFFPSQNAAIGAGSRIALLTGLTHGPNTITAKYRDTANTGGVQFGNRTIWALPL